MPPAAQTLGNLPALSSAVPAEGSATGNANGARGVRTGGVK
jgi:hypothetical protein